MTAATLAAAAAAAAAALVIAVAGPALDGADDRMLSDANDGWDLANFMENMRWPGPERGCATPEGKGGANLELECALSAARVTIATDRAATYLSLKCELDQERAGKITCEELRKNMGEALWNHTSEALTQDAGEVRVLRWLSLTDCDLTEPLRCLLRLVAASDVATVQLRGMPEQLQPDYLEGLDSLTHLRILDISVNVTSVPYGALAALPALRRLVAHGGALRLEEGGARWRPLHALRMLELAEGGLRDLPARAFLGLSQLRNLSLWDNRIETIHEDAFEGLTQLECLSLNQNRLRALPAGVLLPTPRLRLLHLYGNRVPRLPQLSHLNSLEEVWLNNGNETSLMLHNDTFSDLPALRKLKLESCGVSAAPARLLRGCRALAELSLSGNRLVELPPELLAEQRSLRVLNLARNRLRTLPRALLVNTTSLEDLNLNNNNIDLLPNGVFLSLAALEKLDLSHNKLKELRSRMFEGLSDIKQLLLSYNELSLAVDADVAGRTTSPLAELSSLSRLELAHNHIRRFMDDWRDLHHLEALDLSYNSIVELTDVDLQLLSEAEVDVRHNNISRVGQMTDPELDAAGEELSRARFLLDHNPFHCDCRMYDFVVALRRPSVAARFDLRRARCSTPRELYESPLMAVPPGALLCAIPAPDCPENCTCAQRPINGTLELDCTNVPRTIPTKHPANAVRLRLRSPLADVSVLPSDVRFLDLSGLHLVNPPIASARVSNLTVDLSGNNLTSAPLALLEANCEVLLAGNPLACDCDHRESVAGLRRHWARVLDRGEVRCAHDADSLCAGRDALALGLCSGVAVAFLVLIIFRYRTEVRLVLGRFELFDFLLPKNDLGMLEKKYDAFVSFSHHDDAYVRDVLVPALEGGRRPLRLCVHYRDWEVGDLIPEQIDRSVRDSWRTIVVLSEDFVRSVWARHEFRAAHGLERVIVLVLGDALQAMDTDKELRAYKKTHTCIMASHPLVWDRIRDAVFRSKSAAVARSGGAKNEGAKATGGLDVKLHNGRLVNESATRPPVEPKKFPPSFNNLANISNSYLSKKIGDGESEPPGLFGRWFICGSNDRNQNRICLPK